MPGFLLLGQLFTSKTPKAEASLPQQQPHPAGLWVDGASQEIFMNCMFISKVSKLEAPRVMFLGQVGARGTLDGLARLFSREEKPGQTKGYWV